MLTGVQIISVLGHDYDASQSLQRFWMPFMPFTLADLLSVPTFSPLLDSDVPHDAQSIMGFPLVTKSIIHQVLSGVAYLHSPENRIAHRDIKPRNILLDTLGVAVLIDFGVAYSPTAGPRDVWPEPEGKMYFEVGSGYVGCPPILNMRRRRSVVVLLFQTLSRSRASLWCAQVRCNCLRLVGSRYHFCGILHNPSPSPPV
jgi:serine/threonine protein kinase